MKLRPLGTAPARPAAVLGPVAATAPLPATTAPPIIYAAVAERDAAGVPRRLALPGTLAAKQVVPLYVRERRGTLRAAAVDADGRISFGRADGIDPDAAALAKITPGRRIIAAVDAGGRILSLAAV